MMPYQRTDWTSISRHQDQNHFIQVRNSLVWRKSKSSPLHYLAHKSRLSAQGDVLSVALQLQKWSMWATPGDGNLMFEQDAGKSRARMKTRNGQSASYVLIQHRLFLMRRAFKMFAKYPPREDLRQCIHPLSSDFQEPWTMLLSHSNISLAFKVAKTGTLS